MQTQLAYKTKWSELEMLCSINQCLFIRRNDYFILF